MNDDELIVIIKSRAQTMGDYAIAWAVLQVAYQLNEIDSSLLSIRDELMQSRPKETRT